MPYTESWTETAPDGSIIPVSQLDDWIRKTKVAIRERLEDATVDRGLIEAGSWSTGPIPKSGSARAYVATAANIATLPLQDGRIALTSDTNQLFHLKSTGAVPITSGGAGGGPFINQVIFGNVVVASPVVTPNLAQAVYPMQVWSQKDASIFMIANLDGTSVQWAAKARVSVFGVAADGGTRILQNQYINNAGVFGPHDVNRPQMQLGGDSASTLSYAYVQPSAMGVGAYSGVGSQTLVISGAGYSSLAYEETAIVDIMLMQGGRMMRFDVCATYDPANPTITGTNKPQPVIEYHQDQTIWYYKSLITPVCSAAQAPLRMRPGVAPTTPQNGDEWSTAAGRFCQVGGVTKQYTLV